MLSREKKAALQRARALEEAREIDAAVRAYVEAGAPLDGAALLAKNARYGDAGRMLLGQLGVEAEEVGQLDAGRRKLARMAASYLAKAKELGSAVRLYVALGEVERAAELLERSGDLVAAQQLREGGGGGGLRGEQRAIGGEAVNRIRAVDLEREGKLETAAQVYIELKEFGEAARVMHQLGKSDAAAQLFARANMPYEAAVCYLKAGDTGKGLDNLIRVRRAHPRYRTAALHAIGLASKLNVLGFQIEHFLTEFIRSGPEDEQEREAFVELATLYAQHDMPDNAQEALRKVLTRYPDHAEAQRGLEALKDEGRPSSGVYERVVKQDTGFLGARGKSGGDELLPGLPALPALPSAPAGPAGSPAARSASAGLSAQASPVSHAVAAQHASGTQMGFGGAVAGAAPPAGAGASTVAANYQDQGLPTAGVAPAPAPAAPAAGGNPFVVGGVVANRYRLDACIGQGGMAIVFKAFDLELDEPIALKVFHFPATDPEGPGGSVARFKQELKLNRQLLHPNILRLYDIGISQDRRYISMELLIGRCLDEILAGPLPIEQALTYLVQICRGLGAAHDQGVIHRDIKPQNIFVTGDDVLKIMDFGIAKQSGGNMTKTGITAGTPKYMAPEQVTGFSSVTPAADLYAVGVVAYEMLTGAPPFDHEEMMPLIMMKVNEEPKPMRSARPEIPQVLDHAVLRLLEKDCEKRFSSCTDLMRVLQRVRSQHQADAR